MHHLILKKFKITNKLISVFKFLPYLIKKLIMALDFNDLA